MNLESFVRSELRRARDRVQNKLKPSYEPEVARAIIARYVAAFAVNFTDWLGKTCPWARHPKTRYALTQNLRCEQEEDHIGMLLDFAFQARVIADEQAMRDPLRHLRNEFRNTSTAGLFGTALLTTLEVTSRDFIPALENMGRSLDLTAAQLDYTRSHGEADAEHADDLTEALIAEASEFDRPEGRITTGVDLALNLLDVIFAH